MKKICNRCKVEKPLDEFYKNKGGKFGRRSYCKKCIGERTLELMSANDNLRRIKKQGYHLAHKERFNKKSREYQVANKERLKKSKHEYNKTHKKEISINKQKYRAANLDKIKKQQVKQLKSYASYKAYAWQISFAEPVVEGVGGELFVCCTYCGKLFVPRVLSVKNRIKVLNGKTGGEARLYCSDACKNACPSYGQISNWKGQKPATSREVSAYFRQAVLKRDDWTCQKCGAGIEAELHVHHIEGAVQNPIISNDVGNGITLCKKCHKYVHSQSGCTYYELRCPQQREAA